MSGHQNGNSDDRLHESFRLHHSQINVRSTQFLRYYSRVRQSIQENLQRPEDICTDRCREPIREIKKGVKEDDSRTSLLFNTVQQSSLTEVIKYWQKEKNMGIYRSDQNHDYLTYLRFVDHALLFATSTEQLQKNDVRIQRKYWKSMTQDHTRKKKKTKFSATRAACYQTRKKKCKSTILKLKFWQEVKAWDTWTSWSHSTSRKRPKSRIVSGKSERRSTNTDRSWLQKTTYSNSVSDCSTQR